jgi:hypothetical protein
MFRKEAGFLILGTVFRDNLFPKEAGFFYTGHYYIYLLIRYTSSGARLDTANAVLV